MRFLDKAVKPEAVVTSIVNTSHGSARDVLSWPRTECLDDIIVVLIPSAILGIPIYRAILGKQ